MTVPPIITEDEQVYREEVPDVQPTEAMLKEYGDYITEIIPIARKSRSVREPRWNQCRDYFYCDKRTLSTALQTTAESLSYIMIKGNRIVGDVVGAITSQSPYVNAVPYGEGKSLPARTQAVQTLLDASNFKENLLQVGQAAYYANYGIQYVEYFPDGKVPRIEFTYVDPLECFAYPDWEPSFDKCTYVSRNIVRSKKEIERLIADGAYLPGRITGYTPPDMQIQSGASSPDDPTGVSDDEPFILLSGVCRLSPSDPWMEITTDGAGRLYRCHPYKYERCPFKRYKYKPDRGTDGQCPSVSIATDLMQAQFNFDLAFGVTTDGMRLDAHPAIGTTSPELAERLAGKCLAGEVILLDSESSITPIHSNTNVGDAIPILEVTTNFMDQASSVSQQDFGLADPGVQTKGEAELLAQGSAQGINIFIQIFAEGVEGMWAIVDEFLRTDPNKDWFHAFFGGDVEYASAWLEEANQAVLVKVAVSNVEATPQNRMRLLNGFAESMNANGVEYDRYKWAMAMAECLEQIGLEAKELLGDPLTGAINTIMGAEVQQPGTALAVIDQLLVQLQQLSTMAQQPGNKGTGGAAGGQGGGAPRPGSGMPSGPARPQNALPRPVIGGQ